MKEAEATLQKPDILPEPILLKKAKASEPFDDSEAFS